MEFLGIGPMELIFILIIVLLVIGPKDIEKTAGNVGRFLNRVNRSPNYQAIRKASDEIRNLPQRLVREAQLDELKELEELRQVEQDLQETAKTISAAHEPFQAWVKDMRAPLESGNAPPSTASTNGPAATPPKSAVTPAPPPPAAPVSETPASETPAGDDPASDSPPKD